jgi:hypothetical protein
MVTTLTLFGTGWMTWTVLQCMLNDSTIVKLSTRKILTLIQICLALSLDGVRHCILAFMALALTSLTKHNLSTVNETNVSNTGWLTCVSCCTIS